MRSLLFTEVRDASGAILATSPVNASGFPLSTNKWERIITDVDVAPNRPPVTNITVRVGYPFAATKGRIWISRISVVRQCPGIPHGALSPAAPRS